MKKESNDWMTEIRETGGITLTINADADGLKFWKAPHTRHIQKGPDVLTISTPGKNLIFRTTFMPGSEIGRLHCIIAGELTAFEGMDFTPEDWQALSDYLTTRNMPQIKKKSATEKYIEKTLKAQRAASDKARLEFEKTGDPEIVIKFILGDFSGETQKEPWVVNVLAEWHREKRKELQAKLIYPKGHPETPYSKKLANLIFVDRIDRYKAEQGSLSAAIITEMERRAGGELAEVDEKIFKKLSGDYQRYKKIPTICRVIEGPDYYQIILYASKFTLGERPLARVTMNYKFPKK